MKTNNPKTIEKNIRLYNDIKDALQKQGILAYTRTASTGNIHLIVTTNERKSYSVIRFAHTRQFKIFYPAFTYNNHQETHLRKEWMDVVNYFTARI